MGTQIQDFVIYVIVVAALWFLYRKFRRTTTKTGCGGECGCVKEDVKRNPVIEKYIKKNY